MDTHAIGTKILEARRRRNLTQEQVGEAIDIGQSTLDRIEKGDFKRIPSKLHALATYLGLVYEELDPELGGGSAPPPGAIVRQVLGDNDFKVYASAEGGPGEIIISTDPVDFMPRPSIVANVREAYGLIITGTSMFPEFRHGETAIVNPLLPIQPNEVHVFYAEREGTARATIKELRRQTEESWLVTQHNPPEGRPRDFALKRKDWRWAHRVLGKYSRR